MQKLNEQISKFWQHQTTPSENREILKKLEEPEMEWEKLLKEDYQKMLSKETAGEFSDAQKSRIWKELQKLMPANTGVKPGKHVVWRRWAAAAASVVLCVGIYLYQSGSNHLQQVPTAQSATADPATLIVKENTGIKEQQVYLPDSSQVMLYPGSKISYAAAFEEHARNIELEGKALFEVVKDAARPFTVTARGYATTALGTRFIVDAAMLRIHISLLQGKIVIKATGKAGMAMKDVYLEPGQVLDIDVQGKHFEVKSSSAIKDKRSSLPVADKEKGTAHDLQTLEFEKTKLDVVFQRLSKYYKTTIICDEADIQRLSFTGSFKPSDDIDLALNVICNMNGLQFMKQDGHIIITK